MSPQILAESNEIWKSLPVKMLITHLGLYVVLTKPIYLIDGKNIKKVINKLCGYAFFVPPQKLVFRIIATNKFFREKLHSELSNASSNGTSKGIYSAGDAKSLTQIGKKYRNIIGMILANRQKNIECRNVKYSLVKGCGSVTRGLMGFLQTSNNPITE